MQEKQQSQIQVMECISYANIHWNSNEKEKTQRHQQRLNIH
jgi:hypothetical protein